MLLVGTESTLLTILPRFKTPVLTYAIYAGGIHPILDVFPNAKMINYGLDPKSFDIAYAQLLLNIDYIFYEYFSKVIYPLYNGHSVYIICPDNYQDDEILSMLIESFLKFIQQRYGYNGAEIHDEDDFEYINPDDMTFNINGVYNLDIDKERFSYMYATQNTYIDNGGNVQIKGFEY